MASVDETSTGESNAMAAKMTKNTQWRKTNPIGKCYTCIEYRHYKRDCPKRKHSSSAVANAENDCDAFTGVDISSSSDCSVSKWFLDSGASDHMTNRQEWFATMNQIDPKPVRVGNGELIYATGRGDIILSAFDGVKWNKKTMKNVLYVPDIKMSLFSAGCAWDKGLKLEFDSRGCVFRMNNEPVAVGERVGRSYAMKFDVIIGTDEANAMVHAE